MFYIVFMLFATVLTGWNVHTEAWGWAATSTLAFFFNAVLFLKDDTV